MADWDHIIVGAGSAGCVLAKRLADAGRRRREARVRDGAVVGDPSDHGDLLVAAPRREPLGHVRREVPLVDADGRRRG